MSRRILAPVVTVVVLVAAVGFVQAAGPRRPVSELDFVVADAGDTYASIVTQRTLSCTGTQLSDANGRSTVRAGFIVFLPPSCVVPAFTTTTVPPTTAPPPPPATTTTVPASGVLFSETFDTEAAMGSLVFEVHNGIGAPNTAMPASGEGGNLPVAFNGDHDTACGAATTTRPLVEDHTVATHVYHCRSHFMTAVNSTGYVVAAFTPSEAGTVKVFPATADRICWDQNLTNLGGRKWLQVAVLSAAKYQSNGTLVVVNPDNAANAGNSPVASGDDFVFSGQFNSVFYFKGAQATTTDYSQANISITDKMTRYTTCIIDNGNGTVTRTQQRPTGPVTFTGPGSFPAGPRVFILSDDSYNPDKFNVDKPSESPQAYGITDPYTWHWDNIVIDEG